jgi:phospholipid/cholesterol/gamma-HCH transport system ATP-binding protein
LEKEKVIDVRNLSAVFDDRMILSDVSFSAYKGEVTVILGGSGSGKTTVLKHLVGLYYVNTGYVSVLGRDLAKLTEDEQTQLYLQMGVFYQDGALLNSLTIGENVALPLQQQGNLPNELIEDIVYMKLGLVNLEDAYHLYPSELSGGMLKRAALARAIIMDPPVLFCDEPGAGLDPISLESLDNLILNLKELLGISILLVTHEVSSILRVANRIVYLDQGKVVFEGTLKQALATKVQAVQDFFSVFRHENAREFGK